MGQSTYGTELLARTLAGQSSEADNPLTHLAVLPARTASFGQWPEWIDDDVRAAVAARGIAAPWRHQVAAAELAHAGRHVSLCTGTASGKSLAYQLPILTRFAQDPLATALYLSPTKALGTDQLRSVAQLIGGHRAFSHLQPCMYDGDTDQDLRQWARRHSRWIFTNPDMLHIGINSTHAKWRQFLANLAYVVVDECHHYRGVFGSHTALVLQRLLRLARLYGADPVVIGTSATVSNPAEALTRLIGEPAEAVADDASPQGERTVALWEPGFSEIGRGENDAPVRRPAAAEAARLLADFVVEGARTLCFVRSRRGTEITALRAQQLLAEAAPGLAQRVAAYRGGLYGAFGETLPSR